MLELKPVTMKDVRDVARTMRAEDRRELAKIGMEPEEALVSSLMVSANAWTAFDGFKPVCIFGVAPDSLLGARARLWLLGSERLEACKLSYFKTCVRAVRVLSSKYPVLWNLVDPEYERAHKWLTRLGARWGGQREVSPGVYFDYFEIRRK